MNNKCPKCGVELDEDEYYARCPECGEVLDEEAFDDDYEDRYWLNGYWCGG
jgi:transcription initiation factor TFIIIB Brf1 subunit/transcription initiation factor TFIIB